jgi:cysteinyl-tRNA synthetase
LPTIGVLEKPKNVANIQVCILYPPLKGKKFEVKNLDLWAENSPWNKKTKIDYTNKANVNHIKRIEIKLVLWLAPPPPPKEVAKVVTSNWGKGKRQRQKLL